MSTLGGDLMRATDPVGLAVALGLDPDAWQADVLRSRAPRVLLNCSRQSGKSTVAGLLAVHQALYVPDSLVLMVSPSQRQSAELYRTARSMYRRLGRPVPVDQESALQLALENGSRIVALPGSEATIRGYSSVALLCVDEAARVEDGLWESVAPMVAVSGGRVLALSTPWGRRGWWAAAWHEAAASWERVKVTAWECPRIPRAFLEEQQASLGPWFFAQEYEAEFRDTAEQLFSTAEIERAFTSEVAPLRFPSRPGG